MDYIVLDQAQQTKRIDIPVKCTRCRHETMESAWLDKPEGNSGGISMTVKVCPRCSCKSYYDMRPQVAWCWATGLIEMGDQPPTNGADGSGPILIARGPKSSLKLALTINARHGMGASAGKFLVPGVPEAETGKRAVDALYEWLKWCAKGKGLNNDVTWEVANAR